MVKPHGQSPLAGGQAQAQGDVGLAGAAVSDGDDVLPPLDVFAAGRFHDQGFVHRGDGQEVEGVQALDRGEADGPDPALHHALVAVDEFQFGQPEQVVGMVSASAAHWMASLRYSLWKVGSFSP